MSWNRLLTRLEAARQQLDQATALACTAETPKIYCAAGCRNCCSLAVNCSFPEALAIAAELNEVQWQALAEKLPLLRQLSRQADNLKQFLRSFRQQLGGCPFLQAETGHCTIYPLRPLSCRALLSTRNASWCGVDFGELHPLEKQAFLSSLDAEIVAYPTHYLAASQELGLELEAGLLGEMRDRFGVALSGNLLYQVWLEREVGLSEVLPQGFAATRELLQQRQLELPYLLHLQSA